MTRWLVDRFNSWFEVCFFKNEFEISLKVNNKVLEFDLKKKKVLVRK